MAKQTGLSQTAIVRIWRTFGLQPHRVENFKFSKTRKSSRRFGISWGVVESTLEQRNRNPKPFVWTADADLIPAMVERLCKRISKSGD